MTAATTKIERSSDPHGARRARPDECTQFETEFRQALARAETDSDLAAVEAVRDRWWGAAVMAANPLSEAERDQVVARAGDERLVVCRRVDHQTVVAPVGHEVAGQRAHSVAADTPPVHDGVEEDIDRGVPVRGLLLLAVLRHPAHRAVQQDGEACGGRVVEGPLRRSGLVARTSGVYRIRRSSGTCSAVTPTSTTRSPRRPGPAVAPDPVTSPSSPPRSAAARAFRQSMAGGATDGALW